MTEARATLLIPAWNEAAVIATTLSNLSHGAEKAEFHVIVIANACTDDTAARARHAAPDALVIETPVAGKTHALNLGFAHALPDRPVICLDADLSVTAADLRALIAPITAGAAQASCGHMIVDCQGASRAVRAFHTAWALNPYFAQGKFGGLFALSHSAARGIYPLPPVTADDEYIRRQFRADDIAFVETCSFRARAPRDLPTLARVRRRVLRGTQALARLAPPPTGKTASARLMLRHAAPRPDLWPALALYAAVMIYLRLSLAVEPRGRTQPWERDLTTRKAITHPD